MTGSEESNGILGRKRLKDTENGEMTETNGMEENTESYENKEMTETNGTKEKTETNITEEKAESYENKEKTETNETEEKTENQMEEITEIYGTEKTIVRELQKHMELRKTRK